MTPRLPLALGTGVAGGAGVAAGAGVATAGGAFVGATGAAVGGGVAAPVGTLVGTRSGETVPGRLGAGVVMMHGAMRAMPQTTPASIISWTQQSDAPAVSGMSPQSVPPQRPHARAQQTESAS